MLGRPRYPSPWVAGPSDVPCRFGTLLAGYHVAMEFPERLWLEAAAGVQSDVDASLRDEAREVYVAEAARTTLASRSGRAVVTLRSGVVLKGQVVDARVRPVPNGFVAIEVADGRVLLVLVASVVTVSGTTPRLVQEDGSLPLLGSLVREAWSVGESVRLLLADGRWVPGVIAFVGADHVDIASGDARLTIPLGSVEAWDLGLLA
jgi:hypothetical protein